MLKIVTVPSNILSSPTKPVAKIDDKIKKIVSQMEKILVAQIEPPGVGLAANQVGENLSIFIIRKSPKEKIKVFINPKVIKKIENVGKQFIAPKNKGVINHATKKKIKLEGCLSIPKIWGPVKRAERIFVHYQDLTGKKYLKWFSGFEAMIIQHEMDHLNGIVFTQRAVEQKNQLYKEKNGELNKIELA